MSRAETLKQELAIHLMGIGPLGDLAGRICAEAAWQQSLTVEDAHILMRFIVEPPQLPGWRPLLASDVIEIRQGCLSALADVAQRTSDPELQRAYGELTLQWDQP